MHGSLEPLYPLVAAGDEHLIPRLNYLCPYSEPVTTTDRWPDSAHTSQG